jgi:hypothetical protein
MRARGFRYRNGVRSAGRKEGRQGRERRGMNKTLREIMGMRDSIGNIRIGDTVRIKCNGHTGRVMGIGRYGLLDVQGVLGVYHPTEVEVVNEGREND